MAKRERAAGDAPKRKVGRPKGTPKTGGRVKKSFEEKMDAATDTWALKVLAGESLKQAGKTGKQFWGPASLEVQESVATKWWNKRRPNLVAAAIKADVTTETISAEPVDKRELSKGIITILETAELADAPVAEPAGPSAPPAQLQIGRDDIIEIQATEVFDATTELDSSRASGLTEGLPPAVGLGAGPDASSPHQGNGSALSLEKGGVVVSSSAASPHEARADNRPFPVHRPPKVIRRAPR